MTTGNPSTAPAAAPTVYLLDANILLRLAQSTHPMHTTARAALRSLQGQGDTLATAPQSLYEFWVVATRPGTARGGLGMSATGAQAYLNLFESRFPLLPDAPLYAEWKRLVTAYGVSGKEAHDARLVAAMKVHGLTHLLTFNGKDFARYVSGEGITVIDPATVPPAPGATPAP